MIAWINFAVLIVSSLFFLLFYIRSVSPATLEKVLGPKAYITCGRQRVIAILFEMITVVNYGIYYFYPLKTPLPDQFPWKWWISVVIAIVIGVPSLWLMAVGMRDAGEEAIRPRKEHEMYGGIYAKIRHPQAVGEVFVWGVIAFLLHSPFLALFSLVYIPIFLMMCFAEEQDLLWRYGDQYAAYCKQTGAYFPRRH